ncbi:MULTISPECIES: hypothetical protein [unclassified Lysobacter]|uniref:hypothetical protein n=1 Tax=unclassified Lysobacter TaxID=2635362 RepID=UPI0006F714A3|nr:MULTISPECIES: hypothetical protein [unclassified Lysobacter]KRC31533.1 hypothetical protein ASE10_17560 [Lysobacter sp. Root76]KRD65440.1 hypothetical protein ASE45_18755 [Lysobacter sp. Root96]
MPREFDTFHRYWMDWEAKLKPLIRRHEAQLLFPNRLSETLKDDGSIDLSPAHPICIANAPQKAATGKRGPSHRNTLVIDGGFHLKPGAVAPYLVQGRCSLSVFSTTIRDDGGRNLVEIDAMHFDMEKADKPTAYHPIFHVQRDVDSKLDQAKLKQSVADLARTTPDKIFLERSSGLGTQHLRLPTPQMDLFAVLTAVVADFFCNGADKDIKVKTQFSAVLELLKHPSNAARNGFAARQLMERADQIWPCPGAWYPESV